MPDNENIQSHPSFGCIRIVRTNGCERKLFGSNIGHNHTISLTISRAANERTLNSDYIHERGRLISIEMSQTQFAEMMTSIGQGGSVPCTIREYHGESIPEPVCENKTEIHVREFAEHQQDIKRSLENAKNRINELMDKKSITKSDKDEIKRIIEGLKTQIINNTAFQVQMFDEHMEKTIHDAKGEVEAFIQTRINQFAANAITTNIDRDIVTLETKGETHENN